MRSLLQLLRKKPDYRANLEDLLSTHVMMEFQNPHGFLRSRACWIYGQVGCAAPRSVMIGTGKGTQGVLFSPVPPSCVPVCSLSSLQTATALQP